MADIVILGGGLAGISAAYHLEQKGFFDYKLFEKTAGIGGLCGSVHQDGFTFDYTGHLLHINDPYFHQLIENVVGFDQFNTINRRSFIYSQDRYTKYPYQINLHGLPVKTIANCIEGYIKRHKQVKKPENFHQWVLKHFGSGFAKHFFLSYQSKIFAYDLNKITASWTGRFVPSTSLEAIIAGALGINDDKHIGYNAQFFYPKRGGIFFWVKKLADQLQNIIITNSEATKIDIKEQVVYFSNGHVEPYKLLINTMPLDRLLPMLVGKSDRSFEKAVDKLLCNSVLNFNLGIARSEISDKHWIYFPEKTFPFYRIGFPSNFSEHMTPPGCSSLYGEIAYINRSVTWKKSLTKKAINKTKALLQMNDEEIIMKKVIDISHAYVIYNHWRDKQLPALLNALEHEAIYSIGRYGAWKYCSMQETVLDGASIAEKLLVLPAKKWHHSFHLPTKKKETYKENL